MVGAIRLRLRWASSAPRNAPAHTTAQATTSSWGSARAGRLIDNRSAHPLVRPRPSSRKVEAVGTRLGIVGSSAA